MKSVAAFSRLTRRRFTYANAGWRMKRPIVGLMPEGGGRAGAAPLTNIASSRTRFFIRQGGKGWMVYDRDRKGPAQIGTVLAAKLTMEQAEQVKRALTTPAQDNEAFRAEVSRWRIV